METKTITVTNIPDNDDCILLFTLKYSTTCDRHLYTSIINNRECYLIKSYQQLFIVTIPIEGAILCNRDPNCNICYCTYKHSNVSNIIQMKYNLIHYMFNYSLVDFSILHPNTKNNILTEIHNRLIDINELPNTLSNISSPLSDRDAQSNVEHQCNCNKQLYDKNNKLEQRLNQLNDIINSQSELIDTLTNDISELKRSFAHYHKHDTHSQQPNKRRIITRSMTKK